MHKIKKYQIGNYLTKNSLLNDMYADKLVGPVVKNYQSNLNKPVPTMNFNKNIFGYDESMNVKITPPTYSGLGKNLLGGTPSSADGVLADKGKNVFQNTMKKIGPDLLGAAPEIVESGLKIFGGKEATTASKGESMFQQVTTNAFKGALKTGNPIAIGITGALKGLDLLNRYAGSTAKEQGTAGIDTGAYTTQLSPDAGKKTTLVGTYGKALLGGATGMLLKNTKFGKKFLGNSKLDNINAMTAKTDKANLLASRSAYNNKQNQLAAQNTYGDITARNDQRLLGGINTNIISAKCGGRIHPKKLSTIKKKAIYKVKKAQEGSEVDDGQKFQKGGLITAQRRNIHTGAILPSRTISNNVESPFLLNENLPPWATLGISLFDPTGITSWGDVKTAWDDGKFTYDDILQPAGAIPLLGKLAKGTEFAKAKQLLSEGKWINTSKKMGPRRTKSSFDQKYVSPHSARDIAAARRVVEANKLINAGQVGVRLGGDIGTADEVKKNIVNYIKANQIPAKTVTALNSSIKPAELALGGKINIIPEGALHARKNNYEGGLAEQVTAKGIPVITYEEGDKIVQHAEIEKNEVIFHIDTTKQLEKWFKEYNSTDNTKEKLKLEIECGKFLVEELLENTLDKTGLLEEVE